jgi:MFS family permease
MSDRIGRRKPFVAPGAVLGAAGLLVMILGNSLDWPYVGAAICGVAAGLIMGVYLSFAISTLPDSANVARDLGLVNMAATLPYSFILFAAPLLLNIGAATTTRPSSPRGRPCVCWAASPWQRSARLADRHVCHRPLSARSRVSGVSAPWRDSGR